MTDGLQLCLCAYFTCLPNQKAPFIKYNTRTIHFCGLPSIVSDTQRTYEKWYALIHSMNNIVLSQNH